MIGNNNMFEETTVTSNFDLLKFEAMDRISVKLHEVDQLISHPGLTKKAKKKVAKAIKALHSAYQLQSDKVAIWEEPEENANA